MNRIRKLVMMLGMLLVSSVFVACSDDDDSTFGAVPVNSVRVTGTSVTVIWSIVPNDKCAGYEVSILQGSRDGAVVASQSFDNRTCQGTFTGLQPNTRYVIKTQGKPGSGFSGAEVYYREFTTSPLVEVSVVGFDFYQVEGYNSDGELVKTDYYRVNLTWPAISQNNCGGYRINVYPGTIASHTNQAAGSAVVSDPAVNSATIEKLSPATTYTVVSYTAPNAMCDYANGEQRMIEFTTPAAPAK
ncbi:MAG: hypothetical protein HDS15_05260 [Bacteroides sp.]|nr:hypothetical protein [Bacteroides sp.]